MPGARLRNEYLALVVAAIALAALAIWIEDGGPILYRQRRIGERGRDFCLRKLRTMTVADEADATGWGQAEDQRATAVGAFLRRTHLDELPQLSGT